MGSDLAARMLSQKRPRPSASTAMALRRQAETSGSKSHAGHDPLPDLNVRVRFITGGGSGGVQQLPRALTYGPPAALAPLPLHESALVPLKPVWGPRCMPGSAPALPMLEPPVPEAPKVVKATWIEVAETADILKEGWPAMAPSVVYDAAAKDLLCSASYLVYELAGAAMDSMTLSHDWEWTEFPDIAAALRRAGAIEYPYCLATVSLANDKQKWAVGIATNGKHRQHAAKLALAVALAADAPSLRDSITNHPGFRELLEASGIYTGDTLTPPADAIELMGTERRSKKRRRAALNNGESVLPPKMPLGSAAGKAFHDWHYKTILCRDFQQDFACPRGADCYYAHGKEELRRPGEGSRETMPRNGQTKAEAPLLLKNEAEEAPWRDRAKMEEDVPSMHNGRAFQNAVRGIKEEAEAPNVRSEKSLWIELDPLEDAPAQMDGLPLEGLALWLQPTAANSRRTTSLSNQADQILSSILADEVKELQLVDDADWKNLPAVGAALKRRTQTEECMTVAISPTRSLWAVGVGMKGRQRWLAAKLAMAASVALQQAEILDEHHDFSAFPMMEAFVKEAGEAKKLLLN